MLAAARVKPALRRREASSRPRRWGIETMRGADILDTPADPTRAIPDGSKNDGRTVDLLAPKHQTGSGGRCDYTYGYCRVSGRRRRVGVRPPEWNTNTCPDV